jgi:hypothetical protein
MFTDVLEERTLSSFRVEGMLSKKQKACCGTFLSNAGKLLQDYTVSHPRRLLSLPEL